VGLNKDVVLFRGDTLNPEARRASEQFNKNLLRSHSAGVGPELNEETVRATLLARLNTMLFGATGCHPDVVALYLEFLNRGIHPVLPSRGSAGVADITILPHIGLAMMGEGEVIFKGKRMSASEALKEAGLKPIAPFAKDALSILSSNAYAAGRAALVIHDVERLLEVADLVYSLSLEGLNGNMAPLLPPAQRVRPYTGQGETARRIRESLEGSYLWQPHDDRTLQDPLSFRDFSQVHGAVRDVLAFLKGQVTIQLNSSDDNPAVILDSAPEEGRAEQTLRYHVQSEKVSGMVVPTANFEPMAWVLGFEAVGIALSHVSNMSCYRLIKLDTSTFTKLPRFLSPENSTYGLGILENTSTSLNAEIRHLSNPVSADYFARAGEIEDRATNSALVVDHVARIIDNLYYILGMELFHAAQAVDLRRRASPHLALGRATKAIYEAYRKAVPFLDKDRNLSIDIERSHNFLLAWN
jgi:histidine ammonia-lyase